MTRSSARTARSRGCSRQPGGPDEFLERYAVVVTSDHGQTPVERVARLQDAYPAELENVLALASNRAGMVYRLPGCRAGARELAERLDGRPAADVVLFLEDGAAVARRDGAELRFALEGEDWRLEGDAGVLDPDLYPNGSSAPGTPPWRRRRATCSSPPRRAGSSSTAAAVITPAGAAMARSWPATRTCR